MRIQHVIPAIIPDSLVQLERKLLEVRGTAHRVQIDVMDGTYTEGVTWPYTGVNKEAFQALRREDDGLPYWQDFDFEIDLLLHKPEEHLDAWILAGAACLIVHVETTTHLKRIAATCADKRVELALALKPTTDPKVIAPYVKDIMFVQVMGNDHVGEHGVPLSEEAMEQIRAIRKEYPTVPVGVDIGVNEETLPGLLAVGATRFASGSAVFGGGDAVRAWKKLEAIALKN